MKLWKKKKINSELPRRLIISSVVLFGTDFSKKVPERCGYKMLRENYEPTFLCGGSGTFVQKMVTNRKLSLKQSNNLMRTSKMEFFGFDKCAKATFLKSWMIPLAGSGAPTLSLTAVYIVSGWGAWMGFLVPVRHLWEHCEDTLKDLKKKKMSFVLWFNREWIPQPKVTFLNR